MKVAEMKVVFEVVKMNVSVFLDTKGEGELVGLEGFTETMLDKFDQLYEYEVSRIVG